MRGRRRRLRGDADDLPEPDWTTELAHEDEIIRLSQDLLVAARTMGDEEARYLVDAFYQTQENRKRSDNQRRSLGVQPREPGSLIAWLTDKNETLEKQIAKALDEYTKSHMMGDYMRGVVGIGPVLSAGLLAHIYVGICCSQCYSKTPEACAALQAKKSKWKKRQIEPHEWTPVEWPPTIGHTWQFAGIAGSGQKPWLEGQIRPWNAELRTLCWKVGVSFMRFSNYPGCYYGKVYRQRKAYETENNNRRRYKDQAAAALPHFNPATKAYGFYKRGLLPPGHIDTRARRYAVKLFLAHLHEVWFERQFGKRPPSPYPIEQLGHTHYLPPP